MHGVAPVRRIRTTHGYTLAATHRHRIRVIDEEGHYLWRRMDELRTGDWVALQKGHLLQAEDLSLPAPATAPHFNATDVRLPGEASEWLGEFIGYVVGDGAFSCYNAGGRTGRLVVTVSDEQPEVSEWLVRTGEVLFGITPQARKKEGDGSTNYYFNPDGARELAGGARGDEALRRLRPRARPGVPQGVRPSRAGSSVGSLRPTAP